MLSGNSMYIGYYSKGIYLNNFKRRLSYVRFLIIYISYWCNNTSLIPRTEACHSQFAQLRCTFACSKKDMSDVYHVRARVYHEDN